MAYPNLDPAPIGKAIADYLYNNPLGAPGTPISLANTEAIWIQIMTMIYADLKTNMGINAGTFVVAGVQAGSDTVAVTGTGGPAE